MGWIRRLLAEGKVDQDKINGFLGMVAEIGPKDAIEASLAIQIVATTLMAMRTGTRITQRHYAHMSPSHVADSIRAKMPTLGIVEKVNVVSLQAKSRS